MKVPHLAKAGFLAICLVFFAASAYAADPDTIYIRHLEGDVQLAESGSSEWMAGAMNTPLVAGDTVATGTTGRTELFLRDGSIVRASNNSLMRIIAVEEKAVQFRLDRGMAYVVAQGSRDLPIFFDTPSGALDITMPATVRIDTFSGGISEISVLNGEIAVVHQTGSMAVRAGQRIVLAGDGTTPTMTALRSADAWQRWNMDRDRAAFPDRGVSESYAYLPQELQPYSSDFDSNGQWVYTPEYEYVWVPTVITVGTWSPYRYGRWMWVRGVYVWVGYEPWGWAPYHYGSWTHHRLAGWCWVPPRRGHVRWEPAHVAWVHSSRQIGWVPLAPGESYDRRRAPVIHQTNVYNIYNNVTVERSLRTAQRTYRNAGVTNSLVTTDRNAMLAQRAVTVNVTKAAPVPMRTVSVSASAVPARTKSGFRPHTVGAPVTAGIASKTPVTGAKAPLAPMPRGTAAPTAPGTAPAAGSSTLRTSSPTTAAPTSSQKAVDIARPGNRDPGVPAANALQPARTSRGQSPALSNTTPQMSGVSAATTTPTRTLSGQTTTQPSRDTDVRPPATVNVRPLSDRISRGRTADTGPLPQSPSPVPGRTGVNGRTSPPGAGIQQPSVAVRPVQGTAAPAGTAPQGQTPTAARTIGQRAPVTGNATPQSSSQGAAMKGPEPVRPDLRTAVPAPNANTTFAPAVSNPVVRTPASATAPSSSVPVMRTSVQTRPSTTPPAQPVVKAPEPIRQQTRISAPAPTPTPVPVVRTPAPSPAPVVTSPVVRTPVQARPSAPPPASPVVRAPEPPRQSPRPEPKAAPAKKDEEKPAQAAAPVKAAPPPPAVKAPEPPQTPKQQVRQNEPQKPVRN